MLEGEVGAVADCESCEGERCYTEVEGRHGVWLQRVRSVVGMLVTCTPPLNLRRFQGYAGCTNC